MEQDINAAHAHNVGTNESPLFIICCKDNFWREIIPQPNGQHVILEDRYFCWQCMDFHPLV